MEVEKHVIKIKSAYITADTNAPFLYNFNKLLLLIMLIMVSCNKQRHKQVWVYDSENIEKLKGDVKQLYSETRFDVFNQYFDETGNIIKSTKKSLDVVTTAGRTDTTITKINSDYLMLPDAKSDQTDLIVQNVGTASFKSKWILDKHNYIVRFVFSVSDEENSDLHMYAYNASGDLSTSMYIIKSLEDTLKNRYKYDSKHNLIQSYSYDSGKLLEDVRYKYLEFDPSKNWIKRIAYSRYFLSDLQLPPDTQMRKVTYY